MNLNSGDNEAFLERLSAIVETNLSNEEFGVNELASHTGLSRSQIHRRLKKITNKPVTQFIREIRLEKSKELLKSGNFTVSEVAYKVGFGSPSYFIKCFHELYGCSPGKIAIHERLEILNNPVYFEKKKIIIFNALFAFLIFVIIAFIFFFKSPYFSKYKIIEKSVVLLFPDYKGSDSTYLYQINGTIDAVLNNLLLISDLTIFPISTTLKYKDSEMSGIDIARKLHANYVVESSGFNYENKLRLNIKLINSKEGVQVWYHLYDVDANDIIKLPLEIARKIAEEIHAEITPEEINRIDLKPTQNAEAWNYYLKGRDMYNNGLSMYFGTGDAGNTGNNIYKGIRSFEVAIKNFKMALEFDEHLAEAYAQIASIYFLMDMGKYDGKYTAEINTYADLAISNDPQNDKCLLAKAYDLYNRNEYKSAISILEKAVEYNPKSVESYRLLSEIYNISKAANSEKYLEYKLRVLKLSKVVEDDIRKSEDYRLAARGLRIAGFYEKAIGYVEKSIELNPENYSAIGEKAEIIIDGENNYLKAREMLHNVLNKDSSNIEILRFLFTNYYLTRDYQGAEKYFNLFSEVDKNLSYMVSVDFSRLAVLYEKLNMPQKSERFMKYFKQIDRSGLNSFAKSYELTRLYSLENNKDKALEQLNLLYRHEYHFSYVIRMLRDDPAFDNIRGFPEYKKILSEMYTKYWECNKKIQANLKEIGLF